MQIQINKMQLDVEIKETKSFESPFTSKKLEQYEVEFEIRGEENNEEIINLKNGVKENEFKIEIQDKKFEIKDSSYSYRQQFNQEEINFHHTWLISEIEDKMIKELYLKDILIEPYDYEEELDNEGIITTFNVEISISTFKYIKQLKMSNDYFDVKRIGISNEVKKMRLGRILWSEVSTEAVRISATLVEDEYDKNNESNYLLFDPEFYNMQKIISKDRQILKNLISVLKEKNVISSEELATLENPEQDDQFDNYMDFYLVKDLDEYLKKH